MTLTDKIRKTVHTKFVRLHGVGSLSIAAIMTVLIQGCAVTENAAQANDHQAQVQVLKTPNGIDYWYFAMPDADRTAVAINWTTELADTSVAHETMPRVGIDLMLNGGAGGRSAEEIIADFEDLDSGSRLSVQPQEISGFIVSPEEHMEKAAEIANLVLTKPNFDEKWFNRERKNLIDAAVDRETNIWGLAWNLSRELMLENHPYRNFWSLHPVDGVKSIQLGQVKDWHAQAFTTSGITVTAAGPASAEKAAAEIDRVLADMPDHAPAKPRIFNQPVIPSKTILLHQPDSPKSLILAIGSLPPHSDGLDIPVQLGIGVLGHGKQSRLFKAVRSGLRAAYGFGAGPFNMTRQHRLFNIGGEVETAKLQEALDETEKTYEKFRRNGIGPLEFPIAKKFYRQEINSEMEKPSSVAYLMMESLRNDQGIDYVPGLIDEINALKRGDVNRVIEESFLAFDSLLKIIVTPDADAIKGACTINSIEEWKSCL